MLGQPHPFARFVRLLGRGKTLSRALTIEEAEQAMAMILAGETLPEQLGAFLMLLRIKEETGEEIAGFIRAARAALPPSDAPSVDLDWPAYAGKKRQLPWFLLAALLMAQAGWRVAMHGLDGVTEGRLYVGETLAQLGVPYPMLLYERFLGRPFAGHKDSISDLIGDSLEETGFESRVTTAVIATMADRAVRMFPMLKGLNVVRTWSALRVMSPDGFPIYDQSASHPGAYLVTCHSGVTLAANHVFDVASQIASGRLDDSLLPYSARRFHVSQAA